MSEGRISTRREGALQWVIIDNPARLNAISNAMNEQLYDRLMEIERDPEIRVVLVIGAGEKAFMSGGDLSEYEKHRSTAERMRRSVEIGERTARALRHLGKPTVAVIRGWCVGGGMNLALNCDLRICADDARFFHPALRHGQGVAYDATAQLVSIVGPAAAREIMFTARRYDAQEALRIGLVNQVVPVAELESYARAYAEEIAGNAPLSILSCKRTIEQALADPDQRDLALVDRLFDDCVNSADYQEGARAFTERRKPRYIGA